MNEEARHHADQHIKWVHQTIGDHDQQIVVLRGWADERDALARTTRNQAYRDIDRDIATLYRQAAAAIERQAVTR